MRLPFSEKYLRRVLYCEHKNKFAVALVANEYFLSWYQIPVISHPLKFYVVAPRLKAYSER